MLNPTTAVLDTETEVIGFEGRKLLSDSYALVANPFFEEASGCDAEIEIYRTRSGAFVVLATPDLPEPASNSSFAHWGKYQSLKDLMADEIVAKLYPPDRHELFKKLSAQLGKDSATWIE